jgi:uncharacterized protein with PQ loop repeat
MSENSIKVVVLPKNAIYVKVLVASGIFTSFFYLTYELDKIKAKGNIEILIVMFILGLAAILFLISSLNIVLFNKYDLSVIGNILSLRRNGRDDLHSVSDIEGLIVENEVNKGIKIKIILKGGTRVLIPCEKWYLKDLNNKAYYEANFSFVNQLINNINIDNSLIEIKNIE